MKTQISEYKTGDYVRYKSKYHPADTLVIVEILNVRSAYCSDVRFWVRNNNNWRYYPKTQWTSYALEDCTLFEDQDLIILLNLMV